MAYSTSTTSTPSTYSTVCIVVVFCAASGPSDLFSKLHDGYCVCIICILYLVLLLEGSMQMEITNRVVCILYAYWLVVVRTSYYYAY